MTPADAPRLPLSHLGFARLLQNTSSAPRTVQAPAAITRPKARAMFPCACKTIARQQVSDIRDGRMSRALEAAAVHRTPCAGYLGACANACSCVNVGDCSLHRHPSLITTVAVCNAQQFATYHLVPPVAWKQHGRACAAKNARRRTPLN
jgi:hypothetical protein